MLQTILILYQKDDLIGLKYFLCENSWNLLYVYSVRFHLFLTPSLESIGMFIKYTKFYVPEHLLFFVSSHLCIVSVQQEHTQNLPSLLTEDNSYSPSKRSNPSLNMTGQLSCSRKPWSLRKFRNQP